MHWTFHNRQRTNLFVDSLVNDTGDNVTVLVSLFLEDLELFLQDSINSGLLIDDLVLICLLFYRTVRMKNINCYYYVRPLVYTCFELFSSNDNKYLYSLACYAKAALSIRNTCDLITIH